MMERIRAHLARPTVTQSPNTAQRRLFSVFISSMSSAMPIKGLWEDDRGAISRLMEKAPAEGCGIAQGEATLHSRAEARRVADISSGGNVVVWVCDCISSEIL